jgi:hypothetical protein
MADEKSEKEERLDYTIQSFAGQFFVAILPVELCGRYYSTICQTVHCCHLTSVTVWKTIPLLLLLSKTSSDNLSHFYLHPIHHKLRSFELPWQQFNKLLLSVV